MKNICMLNFLVVALLFWANVKAYSQTGIDLPEGLGGCLGIYKTEAKNLHKDLKDFDYFQLKKIAGDDTDSPVRDSDNKISVAGKLKTSKNQSYEFRKASVRVVKIGDEEYYKGIDFITIEIRGISYKFVGEFVEIVTQEKEGDPYIKIKGILTKYKNGKKVFSAEIPFYEFGEL